MEIKWHAKILKYPSAPIRTLDINEGGNFFVKVRGNFPCGHVDVGKTCVPKKQKTGKRKAK